MKLRLLSLISLGFAGLIQAQTPTTQSYTDATGEIATPGSGPHIDISSVDVTLDAAQENLTFKINLQGDPTATNWGKYMIAVRSGTGGTANGNGWGRPINFAAGMTHWIAGWADGGPPAGGAEVWAYSGGAWTRTKASYDALDPLALPVINSSSYSITVPVTLLNVTPGQTFTFDVYTSGGGGEDGAVDALSATTTTISNWSDTFTTTEPRFFGSLDPEGDEDGDGYTNGNEQDGTAPPDGLGYPSNPLIPNYTNMNVSGDFNTWSTSEGTMSQGSTASLVTQYQWTYERRFAEPATAIAYKFTTNNSFDINWGQGGSGGSVARDGGDIPGFVGASGIYRFFFDQANLTHTLTRRTFTSESEFLAAYASVGLAGAAGDDDDDDGLTNAQEFTHNTDPLNSDTDGDGTSDSIEVGNSTNPLVQLRDITFSVDMNVQITKGNHTAGDDVELLVFSGAMLSPNPGSGYLMEDSDEDGIYTVTLTDVPGFEGQPFGAYKFFNNTAGAPNSGYEEGFDRNFDLGSPGAEQVLATVFFSNDSTLPGYGTWAAANAGGGAFNEDFDGDGVTNGVEYFMGETGSTFTLNPSPDAGKVVSWPRDSDATGVSFKVLKSETLASGSWVDVTADADVSDPNFVKYTLPAASKVFVRLQVTQN